MTEKTERGRLSDQQAFDRLLDLLHPDREQAGEVYVILRMKLCDFFAVRHCRHPEALADEALVRLADKLAAEMSIENVHGYAFGIARHLVLEGLRKDSRETGAPENLPETTFMFQDKLDDALVSACLTHCFSRLPDNEARLFVAYYCTEDTSLIQARKDLAKQENLTPLALRLRAFRIREKLEPCMKDCLQHGPKNLKHLVKSPHIQVKREKSN